MNISVIITTYNRSDFAKRAIQSVINQTYQPKEIIVIEDSSETDVKKWLTDNHPEINYYRNNKNSGLAASRNRGIQFSKYEWIAFLDDDDEWLPNRLEEQVKCYSSMSEKEKEHLACIQVGAKKIGVDGNLVSIQLPVNDGILKESIMKFGASTPSSAFLFSKKALEEVDGFDETLSSGIDHDIWMKLAVGGYKTKALKKPLVIVHLNAGNTMMTDTNQRINGINQYVNKWLSVYIEWFGEEKGKEYARNYYTSIISKLAGQKLASHQFSEFLTAIDSIWRFTGSSITYLFQALTKVFKIYTVERIPFIKTMVQRSNLKSFSSL